MSSGVGVGDRISIKPKSTFSRRCQSRVNIGDNTLIHLCYII